MGGKSSPAPAAPPPPDYASAAKQTAAGDLQTAQYAQIANMVNQQTPYGSVTYTPTVVGRSSAETGSLPLYQWTQKVSLSPEEQALFNQNQQINRTLGNVAQQGVGYVETALNKPLTAPNELASRVSPTAQGMTTNVETPDLQTSVPSYANQLQVTPLGMERASGNVANNAANIRTSTQDPNLLLQDTTNALYRANTQYLDPQFNIQQAQLENKLANQGITRGSEAYNNAMGAFNMQKQQAYESARNQAIGGGMQAAQGMFGMGLQGANFANQALGQQFGQNLSAQQLANAAASQNTQQALAAQQARNQALGQAYSQNLGAAGFGNQAAGQQFNQAMQNAALNNAMQNQLFGQNLSAAQFQNQAANQAFQQAQALQQNPINMLNAVRTGQQMQVANIPQVAVSAPGQQATTSGPDMLGAANALGNYNMNAYQAQLQANAANAAAGSNMVSGIVGGVAGMI